MDFESWLLVSIAVIAVLTLFILIKNAMPGVGTTISQRIPDSGLKRLLSSGKYHVITGEEKRVGNAKHFNVYEERHNQSIQDVVKTIINATNVNKKIIVEKEDQPINEIPLDNKGS